MERGMNKIVIVTRKTRLKELIQKYNTQEQARFYIEHMGADFSDYVLEDSNYEAAVRTVLSAAEKLARVSVIERTFVPHMIFGKDDVVIVVGQDGLVCNTLKYLDEQMVIGVNPDAKRWDGVLLPFEAGDMERILPAVLAGKVDQRLITLASAKTNDGQELLAVNDLFIGANTHISARYSITWNKRSEMQSSSGIIISTGLGQTGWYRSIIAQANASFAVFGYKNDRQYTPIKWEEERLSFAVREPYPSRSTQADIVFGFIEKGDVFRLSSKMSEKGVIFSDGMEDDSIDFNAGVEVTVGIADKKGHLVK